MSPSRWQAPSTNSSAVEAVIDDVPLTAAFRDHDPDSLRDVYWRHAPLVSEFLARGTTTAALPRLTADTFVTAWERSGELTDDAELAPWLLEIATGVLVAHLRSPGSTGPHGGPAPRNLKVVVDEQSILRRAEQILAEDPTGFPEASSATWNNIKRLTAPPTDPEGSAEEDPPTAEPTPPPGPVRRRARPIALAAAVAAAVVVTLVGLAMRDSGGTTSIASTTLEPVNDVEVGLATAQVTLQRNDGRRELRLRADTLPRLAQDTGYELSLVGPDGDRVTVGRLPDPGGRLDVTFGLPAELDTERYRIVDLSLTAGDPAVGGSATSVMRGTLRP